MLEIGFVSKDVKNVENVLHTHTQQPFISNMTNGNFKLVHQVNHYYILSLIIRLLLEHKSFVFSLTHQTCMCYVYPKEKIISQNKFRYDMQKRSRYIGSVFPRSCTLCTEIYNILGYSHVRAFKTRRFCARFCVLISLFGSMYLI